MEPFRNDLRPDRNSEEVKRLRTEKQPKFQSLLPFRLVKQLTNVCYSEWVDTMLEFQGDTNRRGPFQKLTSSMVTTRTVASLFLGNEASQNIIHKLTGSDTTVKFYLGEKKIRVVNLFAPHGIEFISNLKNDPNKFLEAVNIYKKNLEITLSIFIAQKQGNEASGKKVKEFFYDFNEPIYQKLKTKFLETASLTNQTLSHLYTIVLLAPKDATSSGKQPGVYHAFLIEQFFDQTVKYRLYQSWKNVMTLSEHISKEEIQSGWEEEELKKFLLNLENLCCSKELSNFRDCFGVDIKRENLIRINEYDDCLEISGMSLRFDCTSFVPKDCKNHLSPLLKQYIKALPK